MYWAAAQLDRRREGVLALLRRVLPDGPAVAALPKMQSLLSLVRCRRGAGDSIEVPETEAEPEPPREEKLAPCLVTPQDEAAVLAGLPSPPMRRRSAATSPRASWCSTRMQTRGAAFA
ncbi:unnamed protein product [Effrenium voratum]|nr:unnamed protein product [Effrenium voratum]